VDTVFSLWWQGNLYPSGHRLFLLNAMAPEPQDYGHLKREIGLFGATALGIGAIIGSGIFIVTGIVAGVAGPAMIFSVILAGVIAVFSAMSVAELGSWLPEEGGTCAYAQKLISPFAGFIPDGIWYPGTGP
jgi:APA family basic amino acid/polyamine antiporter